jgi:hypothetical protein
MARYEEPIRREPTTVNPLGEPPTRAYDADLRVLVRELSNEATTFIRHEVALARAEIRDQIKVAKASSVSMGVGVGLAIGGTLALLCFAIALLDLVMPLWLSALIIAVVCLGIGAAMLAAGAKKLKHMRLKPERALREARTTLHMMREEFR